MDRRRFLGVAGVTAVGLTAGCLGSDDNGAEETDEPADGDPEAVVQEYYELSADIETVEDYEEFTAEVEPLLHSESPIRELLEETPTQEDLDADDAELESVETEVVAEDLDEATIQEQFQLAFFYPEEEELEAVTADLAERNADVEATLEITAEEIEEDEITENWLVVPEGGNWRIFI